jgi:hypothetical protein
MREANRAARANTNGVAAPPVYAARTVKANVNATSCANAAQSSSEISGGSGWSL